jgi:hypothetical protein
MTEEKVGADPGAMLTSFSELAAEARLLRQELSTLLEVFPDTFHPIPLLHRRLARILIYHPLSDLNQLIAAIEYLDTATLAIRDIHQGEPRPIICSMSLDTVVADLHAASLILDDIELSRKGGKGGKKGSDGNYWKVGFVLKKGKKSGVDERVEMYLKEAEETLKVVSEDLKDLWGTVGEVGRETERSWRWRRVERAKRDIAKLRLRAKEGVKRERENWT